MMLVKKLKKNDSSSRSPPRKESLSIVEHNEFNINYFR